ncbi:hypothetical protein LPJ78_000882 [Coemansia sp. RSA 989]|nr:Oxo-4-hydroxy-4-carboxy-5-ureidoimidazoline decarboxylase [Coemansia mojavensis]KAJ1743497.1 hypothetical protein LPJ68_000875 [Coemansia sp. RSA 1086]KAJ1753784.1 hypothetical protein LPJ79_000071 [Coemansia sp. RSA 1821]KAJ1867647.1 hypothetical protein LPJ78_000882 [Coemansia sp. RSA 989]KAJ1875910.1 hypothetical protein LPJ55_000324 [Coemansia sp. RSA 990]KAJ2653793.1 hypothetical protein IWW40_000077 [Coemansia sp. RSA 1250]KAJ2676945.1 hypothetical protein IWW42_000283 [Coemansia sp.
MSAQPTLPTICKTNHLSLEEFANVISLLFEPTALLTQRIYDARPYESYDQLLDKADELIKELSPLEQLEVVNAHPRIGEKASKLSALSKMEQGKASANEDAILAKWAELNKKYEDKYGFRFVIFVNGRSKESLFPIVEERIANSTKNQELLTGLSEMVDIARDRARKLQAASLADGNAPSPKI